ncbi:hypothetical protein ACIPSE_16510 [Streptomyces sp. NPDC090106]|uniref:hypothetical protein n=1 Tax=Streptomyces sp. NPDC090106 TaxID=3365946 RepID=UPI00382661A5
METQHAQERQVGPVASFVRFVVCGGGIGILSSAAVPLLAGLMPWVAANAVITVVSTLLCTELHALFTFGTGRRAGLRRHLQSTGSAAAAYLVTCSAMLLLHTVAAAPGPLCEQAVYLAASGLAGLGRFLVLRLFVFAGGGEDDGSGGGGEGRGARGALGASAGTTAVRPFPAPRREAAGLRLAH